MNTLYLTGSSGGLGQVIRSYFIERNWNVAGFDANDDKYTHSHFSFYQINSTNEHSIQTAFDKADEQLGTPRTLVATIGGLKPAAYIQDIPIDDFRFIVDINLTSLYLSIKHTIERMKTKKIGTIVAIGADTALYPEPKKSVYAACKAAVITLAQVVSEEAKEFGINTNSIVPKVIHTRANEEWGSLEDIPKWTDPKDIAALCHYLSTDEGHSVTGTTIRIPNRI